MYANVVFTDSWLLDTVVKNVEEKVYLQICLKDTQRRVLFLPLATQSSLLLTQVMARCVDVYYCYWLYTRVTCMCDCTPPLWRLGHRLDMGLGSR